MRHDSKKMGRFSFMAVAVVMVYGFLEAGLLPPIIEEPGAWIWWAIYGAGGAVAGLAAFEGWRMMK